MEREIVAKVHQFNHESSVYAQKVEKRCTFASFLAIIAWNAKNSCTFATFRMEMEQAVHFCYINLHKSKKRLQVRVQKGRFSAPKLMLSMRVFSKRFS
ncbi:hypothetical protein G8C92_19695 [Paenibacillus donghaensis]|uniref:hypothetical protein n=1 Tax=Paenibacillus donghaensis TaxID=414771 RepID=UPI0018837693|nr:hypothetical protein [Paenibacillus donghaensis]MBE9916243.1 hypothetical protein [Paenibacillus donghaensis]